MNGKSNSTLHLLLAAFLTLLLFCAGCGCSEESDGNDGGDDASTDDDDTDDDDTDDDSTENIELFVAGQDMFQGTGFMGTFNGTEWKYESMPIFMDNTGAIGDIALTGADSGFAITHTRGSILKMEGGVVSTVSLPPPYFAWSLYGLSVPSAEFGIAAGGLGMEPWNENGEGFLILEYNGVSWNRVPDAQTWGTGLNDVAALASGDAWVIGHRAGLETVIFSRQAGTGQWTEESLPPEWNLIGNDYGWRHIAAIEGPKVCVVERGNHSLNFDGNEWTIQEMPVEAELAHWWQIDAAPGPVVAAVAMEDIIAVSDGAEWTLYSPDLSAFYYYWNFYNVSVVAVDDIYVVGSYGLENDPTIYGLVIHFDGTDWTPIGPAESKIEINSYQGVDFFDTDHGYLGGDGWLLPYSEGAWGAKLEMELPTSYEIAGFAVHEDDYIAISDDHILVEKSQDVWDLQYYDELWNSDKIAFSKLGVFVVAHDYIFKRTESSWREMELPIVADNFRAVAADDARVAVVGVNLNTNRLVAGEYDGASWTATMLVKPGGISLGYEWDVALSGEAGVWIAGGGGDGSVDIGVIYHKDETGEWTVTLPAYDAPYHFCTVAAGEIDGTTMAYFGGRIYSNGEIPGSGFIFEMIGSEEPQAVDLNYQSSNSWWVYDLCAYKDQAYGLLATFKEDQSFTTTVIKRTASGWEPMDTGDVFPTMARPGGIFCRGLE